MNRVPRGVPVAGQFASTPKQESAVRLVRGRVTGLPSAEEVEVYERDDASFGLRDSRTGQPILAEGRARKVFSTPGEADEWVEKSYPLIAKVAHQVRIPTTVTQTSNCPACGAPLAQERDEDGRGIIVGCDSCGEQTPLTTTRLR